MTSSMQDVIVRAESLVKAHMAKYDPSHDWAHVDRVRRLALVIARSLSPSPDMLVVELAALFHDLAAKYDTAPLADTLAPFYASLTSSSPISQEQIGLIARIVPSVSWSTETKLRVSGGWSEWHATCPELHCVQDADRLDAIGAVGIMRCAAFSGAKGRILLDAGEGEDSAEGHFGDKLLNIRERMKTEYGQEEAERRHVTMVQFLEALAAEKARQA